MSARRQPSTTSLSRYANAHSTEFANRSFDFCNAFWGHGDGGVDVLFARMRGSTRTVEELRNFWKERAMIEEQYAKRLASLSKFTLGRDEIGELRAAVDILRQETDKQATFHMQVAQQIKTDLEGQTNQFLNKLLHHKRTVQATIEKEFKTKQTHEGFAQKAREKYEANCMQINALTAQATLQQGKELDKIHLKLDRLQQTVHGNERDFANFTRILHDTSAQWEVNWKAFCDRCQDLEEERIEFMKDIMWAYANAVSTVCVADDESCEKLRLALEQLEPERDMEGFVRDYGTGNMIPDPPPFINFANPDAVPPSSQQHTTHPANFERVTQRQRMVSMVPPPAQAPPQSAPQSEEDQGPPVNTAGVGAGGGQMMNGRNRPQSRASVRQSMPPQNGNSLQDLSRPSLGMRPADFNAEPIAPTEETMLKVGNHAYRVDLSQDPQARPSAMQNGPNGSSHVGQEDDPLARQMEQLRSGAGSTTSNRRAQQSQSNGRGNAENQSNLSPPPGSRGGGPPNRDYRRSAEIVVGLPPNVPSSRPASPNPPTAAFVSPPANANRGQYEAQEVIANYQQSLPGEHKITSRPGSRQGSIAQPAPSQLYNRSRPSSRQGSVVAQPSPSQIHNRAFSAEGGQAGIGAQGRSPSPQPFRPPSRGYSPAQPQQQQLQQQQQQQQLQQQQAAQTNRRNSYRVPGPTSNGQSSPNSMTVPSGPAHQQRPTSPNSVGIALGSDGRVAMDSMADMYNTHQRQGSLNQQGSYRGVPSQQPPPAPVQPTGYQQPQRHPSYAAQQPYGGVPPAGFPPSYPQQQVPPPQAPVPPAPQPQAYQQPPYGQPPLPPQGYGQPAPPQQQQQQHMGYGQMNGREPQGAVVQRNPSVLNPAGGGYYGGQAVVPQPQPQQMVGYGQPTNGRDVPPHPQQQQSAQNQGLPPTGQYTEDGRGVLFYGTCSIPSSHSNCVILTGTGDAFFAVKAMYDYQAVIDEEFDFQQGDIIAVTDTPEDGWWSGELLDEARRQPGRHVFPSNFVCLF
ncbi:hypothetical protein BXZ70DRAFT_315867 [Cristinia sonorae]|uniref:Septation protein imp2 n=1 Tax=Cristinia sonorae TaxID=1940300 RepID=A0A8K0UKH7_9AGAR|nr:hypothetical protein BXZ70DRAFT_315867 [Cristinia sonorae]